MKIVKNPQGVEFPVTDVRAADLTGRPVPWQVVRDIPDTVDGAAALAAENERLKAELAEAKAKAKPPADKVAKS